jgi:hypothetical protein
MHYKHEPILERGRLYLNLSNQATTRNGQHTTHVLVVLGIWECLNFCTNPSSTMALATRTISTGHELALYLKRDNEEKRPH